MVGFNDLVKFIFYFKHFTKLLAETTRSNEMFT